MQALLPSCAGYFKGAAALQSLRAALNFSTTTKREPYALRTGMRDSTCMPAEETQVRNDVACRAALAIHKDAHLHRILVLQPNHWQCSAQHCHSAQPGWEVQAVALVCASKRSRQQTNGCNTTCATPQSPCNPYTSHGTPRTCELCSGPTPTSLMCWLLQHMNIP